MGGEKCLTYFLAIHESFLFGNIENFQGNVLFAPWFVADGSVVITDNTSFSPCHLRYEIKTQSLPSVCHNLRKKRTSVHSTCGLIIKSHNLPEHSNNSGDSQQSGCILQCERWYYSLRSRHQFCYFFFLGRAWGTREGERGPPPLSSPRTLCVDFSWFISP